MAGVVTYGVWKLSLLWRRPGVALQNLRLKSGGRITFSGWTFAACAVLVLVLVTHSGFIQYHKWQGDRYYNLTYADEEAVLSGTVPPLASTDPLRRTAFRAIRHLSFCHEWGLLDTSDTHMKLAWLSLVLGNRGRAIRHLRKAGEIAPDLWQVDYYVGSVLLTAGQLQEALYSLERAVEKHPGDAGGQFKLGNALARLGRFDEAIIAWRALLEREPGFAAARHNLAGALRQLGRTEEAVIEYERALQDNPQDAETHFELGVTYTQTGRAESASEHFRRAVQLDPRYKRFFE
jgi:tetratricopeptide (TPR) repeat protein